MKKLSVLFVFFLLSCSFMYGQDTLYKKRTMAVRNIIDGDTVLCFTLDTVNIQDSRIPLSDEMRRMIDKMVRNVKKVYPYAKLAGLKLRQYNDTLTKAGSDGERRRIMRKAEKELKDQFGNELKNLTFSQGKILIKLLYRETGSSSYELLQELRGKFVAFCYQTFARLFGYNLKVVYDPQGEDLAIEIIVNLIESGKL